MTEETLRTESIELWSRSMLLLRQAIARRLAEAGHPSPGRAATSYAVRGRLGLPREDFAGHTEVSLHRVRSIEDPPPPKDRRADSTGFRDQR